MGQETFTAGNVVAKLLNESYQRLPTQDLQNAYFAGASRDIANALLSGRGDEQAWSASSARRVRQRRVLVWSSDARPSRRVLEASRISGRLPRDTGAAAARRASTSTTTKGSKMEYFLDYRGDVKSARVHRATSPRRSDHA